MINREGRTSFPKEVASENRADADAQFEKWAKDTNFQEAFTTDVTEEFLPEHNAFRYEGGPSDDNMHNVGDEHGPWQIFKCLSFGCIRSIYVEEGVEGKRMDWSRSEYDSMDSFISSLKSHQYKDGRKNEVTLDVYNAGVDELGTWLRNQLNVQLARAYNDSHHRGAHDAWWKLITPEALIILIKDQGKPRYTISVSPQDPADEDYGYQFQIDGVLATDEITLEEFSTHLEEYIGLFKVS
jgi:hypothetical protein